MCHYESCWLSDCPVSFKPLFYRRYVDDTFQIFRDLAHVNLFHEYLNSKHPNIEFTYEVEENGKLPFLDIHIFRNQGKFTTSVFRKNTFTGLGLNFLSYSPKLYKMNSISTLINMAYNICSDFNLFHLDMMFLLNYFTQNAYPVPLFYRVLKSFLDNKFEPKPVLTTVERDIKYVKLPYVGHISYDIRSRLQNILKHTFPQVNFRFVFFNSFTVGSLLRKRSFLPVDLNSSTVYMFTCPQCGLRYLGSSSRWLRHRITEHRGLSIRTGFPLSRPSHSAIRDHSLTENHPFTNQDFKILTFASDRLDLVISESLLIKRMKPELNANSSAFELSLL